MRHKKKDNTYGNQRKERASGISVYKSTVELQIITYVVFFCDGDPALSVSAVFYHDVVYEGEILFLSGRDDLLNGESFAYVRR